MSDLREEADRSGLQTDNKQKAHNATNSSHSPTDKQVILLPHRTNCALWERFCVLNLDRNVKPRAASSDNVACSWEREEERYSGGGREEEAEEEAEERQRRGRGC